MEKTKNINICLNIYKWLFTVCAACVSICAIIDKEYAYAIWSIIASIIYWSWMMTHSLLIESEKDCKKIIDICDELCNDVQELNNQNAKLKQENELLKKTQE